MDLFAGLGGFSEGGRLAGVDVLEAHNHWRFAVDVHAMNHPGTNHVCQDLRQADFTKLPDYDLLLASPACQGHSDASQPKRREYHDAMRATAWAVTDCAEATRPLKFIVENVPQFERWALYDLWLETFRRLGYKLTRKIVCATSFGEAQRRRRLFIVGSLKKEIHLDVPRPRIVPFGPLVDWSVAGWKPIRECRGDDARERLRIASKRFDRCLVQHVTGHRGVSLDEPIRTITTKVQWVLLAGGRFRYLTPRELARGQGFPDSYKLPGDASNVDVVRAVGNAVSVKVARNFIEQVAAA